MRAYVVLVLAFGLSCATTGDEGAADPILPTAGVGPFRKLAPEEVKGLAPFVLDDTLALYRDPAVLRDGSTTLLYAVAHTRTARGDADAIVRTRALDERTFFGSSSDFGRKPVVVLEVDEPWEGKALAGPFAYRREGEVFLYYAASGGIGLARSADGLHFTKVPGPIVGRAGAPSWETTPPHAPSVYALPDGRLRMLYAAGVAIGEAESADGVAWRRMGEAPVLGPSPPPDRGSLLPNEKLPFDTVAVDDPCAAPRISPAGRFHLRVLYTGRSESGSAIGFAGRYGEAGALDRQRVPVYAAGLHESAPALLDLGTVSFLYVAQERPDGAKAAFVAIAAAFAPGHVHLPPAGDFPDAP